MVGRVKEPFPVIFRAPPTGCPGSFAITVVQETRTMRNNIRLVIASSQRRVALAVFTLISVLVLVSSKAAGVEARVKEVRTQRNGATVDFEATLEAPDDRIAMNKEIAGSFGY